MSQDSNIGRSNEAAIKKRTSDLIPEASPPNNEDLTPDQIVIKGILMELTKLNNTQRVNVPGYFELIEGEEGNVPREFDDEAEKELGEVLNPLVAILALNPAYLRIRSLFQEAKVWATQKGIDQRLVTDAERLVRESITKAYDDLETTLLENSNDGKRARTQLFDVLLSLTEERMREKTSEYTVGKEINQLLNSLNLFHKVRDDVLGILPNWHLGQLLRFDSKEFDFPRENTEAWAKLLSIISSYKLHKFAEDGVSSMQSERTMGSDIVIKATKPTRPFENRAGKIIARHKETILREIQENTYDKIWKDEDIRSQYRALTDGIMLGSILSTTSTENTETHIPSTREELATKVNSLREKHGLAKMRICYATVPDPNGSSDLDLYLDAVIIGYILNTDIWDLENPPEDMAANINTLLGMIKSPTLLEELKQQFSRGGL